MSILVNDEVFNDIRDEEIELRVLELLSAFQTSTLANFLTN